MKAFNCFGGDCPSDFGCLLVFAKSASKARYLAFKAWPGEGAELTDFNVRRAPSMDAHLSYVSPDLSPCVVESNDVLPEGVKFYAEDL